MQYYVYHMIFLLVGYLIAGFLASGIFLPHKRLLTFLAAAGTLAESFWLLSTYAQRTFFSSTSSNTVYIVGLAAIFLACLPFLKLWKLPYSDSGSGKRDAYVLIPLLLALASAYLIWNVNGFQKDTTYVMHGFFNGDTTTLVSLVQRSFFTPGIVTANPFSGNGSLEYPSLLHAGLASMFQTMGVSGGDGWLHFLPLAIFMQIFFTVPLFFLLFDLVSPQPKRGERWFGVSSHMFILFLQTGIVLFVMALSWDNFIYPQSHFFLNSIFLLVTALLFTADSTGSRKQFGAATVAIILTFVLLRSNAVYGAAAMALGVSYFLVRALNKKEVVKTRAICLGLALALLATFFTFGSSHSGLSIKPHFSYSAAIEATSFIASTTILMALAIFITLGRQPFLEFSSTALVSMGLLLFFFSQRAIVVSNASRFLYIASFISLPLTIQPLIMVIMWVKRQLLYSTRTLVEWLTAIVIGGAAVIVLFVMPAGGATVSSLSHLLYSNKETVTTPMRVGLWWIQDHAAPDAIVIASPYVPWAIPYFTGRSLLRTSHEDTAFWLSEDDAVLQDLRAAFTSGDKEAQGRLFSKADYLFLTGTERKLWEPISYPKVLDTTDIVIYQLR